MPVTDYLIRANHGVRYGKYKNIKQPLTMRKIWSSEMYAQNLGWRPAVYVIFRDTTETNDRLIVHEYVSHVPGSAFGMVT